MSEFALGSYVRKPSGAFWEGVVVGHYGTKQTEDGVAVQLFGWEDGPVQIYPASALQLCDPAQSRLAPPPPMIKALTDDELVRIQAAIQLEKPGMVVFSTPPPSSHVQVRPLEWIPLDYVSHDGHTGRQIVATAKQPYGIYSLEKDADDKWWILLGSGKEVAGPVNHEADAKTEAQQDLVRRIHAALFAPPPPEVREVGEA